MHVHQRKVVSQPHLEHFLSKLIAQNVSAQKYLAGTRQQCPGHFPTVTSILLLPFKSLLSLARTNSYFETN